MPAKFSTGTPGRECRSIFFTVLFGLPCAGNTYAEKDPYLNLLEAEAGDTNALQIDHTQSDADNESRNRHRVPDGLSFPEFEQALQNNNAGTNALHSSLSLLRRETGLQAGQEQSQRDRTAAKFSRLASHPPNLGL